MQSIYTQPTKCFVPSMSSLNVTHTQTRRNTYTNSLQYIHNRIRKWDHRGVLWCIVGNCRRLLILGRSYKWFKNFGCVAEELRIFVCSLLQCNPVLVHVYGSYSYSLIAVISFVFSVRKHDLLKSRFWMVFPLQLENYFFIGLSWSCSLMKYRPFSFTFDYTFGSEENSLRKRNYWVTTEFVWNMKRHWDIYWELIGSER